MKAAIALLLAITAAAPSASEQAACAGDAMALCVPHVGIDPRAVAQCLIAHKAQLAPACRAVIRRRGF